MRLRQPLSVVIGSGTLQSAKVGYCDRRLQEGGSGEQQPTRTGRRAFRFARRAARAREPDRRHPCEMIASPERFYVRDARGTGSRLALCGSYAGYSNTPARESESLTVGA